VFKLVTKGQGESASSPPRISKAKLERNVNLVCARNVRSPYLIEKPIVLDLFLLFLHLSFRVSFTPSSVASFTSPSSALGPTRRSSLNLLKGKKIMVWLKKMIFDFVQEDGFMGQVWAQIPKTIDYRCEDRRKGGELRSHVGAIWSVVVPSFRKPQSSPVSLLEDKLGCKL
jgi:hypothetical protein